MLQKAYAAQQAFQNEGVTIPREGMDELAFLSGHTRAFHPPSEPSTSSDMETQPTQPQTIFIPAHPSQPSSSVPLPQQHDGHTHQSPGAFAPTPISPLPQAFSLGGDALHQAFAELTGAWSASRFQGFVPPPTHTPFQFPASQTLSQAQQHSSPVEGTTASWNMFRGFQSLDRNPGYHI